MSATGVRLGIDFGTSHTVACVALPGREARPLLFDGSPLLPSAVCADANGDLLVGRDALHTALAAPAAFEPFPKRCIDDTTVLLGVLSVPVAELIAAPLRRVVAEVALITSEPITDVVLTCPVAWGAQRRDTLLAAAALVLPAVRLVAEPVAAACFFVETAGQQLPIGGCALVYDFGAGTFDASVVRRIDGGFETLSTEGLSDSGGLDIDAAIMDRLETTFAARDSELWARLRRPTTPADRRASRQLWDNVRGGKEMLGRAASTLIHVPLFDAEAPVGREELDELAAPIIDQTITASQLALQLALPDGRPPDAVYLTGGSSRMPGVATALHRALGVTPTMVDQPELAVAEGSLRVPVSGAVFGRDTATDSADLTPVITAPGPADLDPADPFPIDPPARSRRLAIVFSAVATLIVTASVAAIAANRDEKPTDPSRTAGLAAGSSTASPSPSAKPSTTASASKVDPCLVGRWRSTSIQQDFPNISGVTVRFSGGAWIIVTYRANGTMTMDFNRSKPKTGSNDGVKWTNRIRGVVNAHVYHDDGYEYISDAKAKGTNTLYRNGERDNSIPLSLILQPEKYECAGNAAHFFGDGVVSDYIRY